MKLDIKTAFIPDSLNLWAFHAGKNKKYFRLVSSSDHIWLDYPGLRANDGMLRDNDTIKKHVLMSDARSDAVKRDSNTKPSVNPNDYNPEDSDRYLSSDVTNITRFFHELKKGDIVIVPPRSGYDDVIVGKIEDDASANTTITLEKFPEDPFPARKIKWINTGFSKRDLSRSLSKRLENPHALIPLDRNRFGIEVFSHVFPTYIAKEAASADLFCPQYRGKNPLETVNAQKTLAFLIATYGAIQRGERDELKTATFERIINEYYSEEDIFELEQSFHSPGLYRVIGRKGRLGLYLAASVALIGAGVYSADALGSIEILNTSEYPSEMTDEEIKDLLGSSLDSVSPEAAEEANEAGKKAKDEVGFSSAAQVRER